MTNKVSKSKTAVRAAREAVRASQKEVLERAARNAEDLAVFFSSRERLDGVDDWLEGKIAGLRQQAEVKRAEHRRTAGVALAALRDRGETMRDISRLTGMGEKVLRELVRFAEPSSPTAEGNPPVTSGRGAAVTGSGFEGADREPAAGPATADATSAADGEPIAAWAATG